MGLECFTLRGQKQVDTQWKLYCLALNIEKHANHSYAQLKVQEKTTPQLSLRADVELHDSKSWRWRHGGSSGYTMK